MSAGHSYLVGWLAHDLTTEQLLAEADAIEAVSDYMSASLAEMQAEAAATLRRLAAERGGVVRGEAVVDTGGRL